MAGSGTSKSRALPLGALESDIQASILVAVTAREGAFAWRNNTGMFRSMDGKRVVRAAVPGSPDILGCYRGRALGIEVKAARGKQAEEQRRFQRLWTKAGGVYAVCRSAEDAVAVLDSIDEGRG